MKKITSILSGLVLLFVFVGSASAEANWELLAPKAISFSCGGGTYDHTLDAVTNYVDGTFDGTGAYDANAAYTWDIDGEVDGDGVEFALVYTGANAGYTLNGIGTIASDGSVSGTTDGNCQSFSMSAGSAKFLRRAMITAPDENENVWGDVTFEAYLVDDDEDAIQWAVRQGTCTAGTNTVLGNVDGHSDVATMDTSNLAMQTFSFTGDMSAMPLGMYCFIYNPVEDGGESNIRLTREFELIVEDVAPLVEITSPVDAEVLQGLVDISGSVTDNVELSHYNLSLYPSTTDLSDGQTHSGDRILTDWCSGTVTLSVDFAGDFCNDWDTSNYADGDYQIRLAARDAAGNRDTSDPYVGNTSSVHVIGITIDNDDADDDGYAFNVDCDDFIPELTDPAFKNCILYKSGVEGNGILKAPGLQKEFNPKSKAAENAGKKDK